MVKGSGKIELVKPNETIPRGEVVEIVKESGITRAELARLAHTDRLLGVRVSDVPVIFFDIEHSRYTDLDKASRLMADPTAVGGLLSTLFLKF